MHLIKFDERVARVTDGGHVVRIGESDVRRAMLMPRVCRIPSYIGMDSAVSPSVVNYTPT